MGSSEGIHAQRHDQGAGAKRLDARERGSQRILPGGEFRARKQGKIHRESGARTGAPVPVSSE
jgi:hypothetical protein